MLQFEAKVLSNRSVAPSWKEMTLSWKTEAGIPLPGHFVTLRSARGWDPLLRRPFAVASYDDHGPDGPAISILYEERGKATALLGGLGASATVDLIGPLGKAFPPALPGERALLAAGGVGLGPVLFLARHLEAQRLARGDGNPIPFVVGFRSASALPDLIFPPGFILCTDDGSAGYGGNPVGWMADLTSDADSARTRVFACGPAPMLAALAALARERSWQASLSAEQWMACGVGACMGCVLPRPLGGGFLRACMEGPVFELGDIDWDAEARRSAIPKHQAGGAGGTKA